MDVLLASRSYNLLAQAGLGRGHQLQPMLGSARPQAPGVTSLHQEQPSALCRQTTTSGSHEVTPGTRYQQAVHLPRQVRFAPPVTETKTATNTSQSQSEATRGRPQYKEHEGHQGPASHPRTGRDRSSTRGPRDRSSTRGPKKPQRGISSEDPMDNLMDFMPSGWRRDLIHMVGCFYTSQIAPLNSREWDEDQDEFMQVMDDRKDSEWLDIKELTLLQFMPYVARCFQEVTGHHLRGLSQHTRWIRARGYYHWKVADLNQLKHCPHLQGLPVPSGPMMWPSELQQPQRPNRTRAAATGASGRNRAEAPSTSQSSGEPSAMMSRAGDGQSWYDQVTREDARKKASKRKRTDTDPQAPGCAFPLGSGMDREEVMGAIYEHVAGQEPPQKNITSRAISAYYPNFSPTAVRTVVSQVLCMIAEYHLACTVQGLMTTSPTLPKAVEQDLPLVVDYTCSDSTGLTDMRVHDHKASSLRVGVWLH